MLAVALGFVGPMVFILAVAALCVLAAMWVQAATPKAYEVDSSGLIRLLPRMRPAVRVPTLPGPEFEIDTSAFETTKPRAVITLPSIHIEATVTKIDRPEAVYIPRTELASMSREQVETRLGVVRCDTLTPFPVRWCPECGDQLSRFDTYLCTECGALRGNAT